MFIPLKHRPQSHILDFSRLALEMILAHLILAAHGRIFLTGIMRLGQAD